MWKEHALKNSIFSHPYLLLTLTAMAWGGNAIAGKLAVGHVSPFLLTSIRWVFACLILLPFALPYLKKDWPKIRENLLFLFILGIIGFSVFNNLMYLSLTYTTAINVAIEQAAMPVIVFILNYILFKTRVTSYQIIGFIITLLGVVVTVTRGNLLDLVNLALNTGDIIMVCAIMVYGTYSVYLKYKPDIHVVSFLSVLAVAAMFGTIPFLGYEILTGTLQWPDTQGWGVIAYAAIFPSIVSQLFWVMGLDKLGSNRGGLFINLVPIFGAIFAVVLLGEAFQFYHALGLILVLGGITLAQKTAKNST